MRVYLLLLRNLRRPVRVRLPVPVPASACLHVHLHVACSAGCARLRLLSSAASVHRHCRCSTSFETCPCQVHHRPTTCMARVRIGVGVSAVWNEPLDQGPWSRLGSTVELEWTGAAVLGACTAHLLHGCSRTNGSLFLDLLCPYWQPNVQHADVIKCGFQSSEVPLEIHHCLAAGSVSCCSLLVTWR